ncbi:MAG: hypothetical protein P8Z76_07870 [Alphaproteobacteria bacterium]
MKTGERLDQVITEIEDASLGGITVPASGLYHWSKSFEAKEELRLDVDGRYPQMVASGVITKKFMTAYWVAALKLTGRNKYAGVIWYKFGQTLLIPYTKVVIVVTPGWKPFQRKAKVKFSGGGGSSLVREYLGASNSFHTVEFEYDTVQGATPVTSVDTHAHPNRPAGLPNESLTIDAVYQRAGFDVRRTGGDGSVPISLAGADQLWTNMEMHDAMQFYWSRFGHRAQWSMWVFTAALHAQGKSLGGIMFDDIGPNHRQVTAIFSDAFISDAPTGDPNPSAWVQRMRFWTACHEMGHGFNLAHSWQKAHPPSWGTPWIPLSNENEARSFMNYPYNVAGGQTAFFADFTYRFSNQELLFMRHAPGIFVQMGNADWFDHHGFEQAVVSPEPAFQLVLRSNRKLSVFEFMEPPELELKLTNISSNPQVIEEGLLASRDRLTVIIKKDGKAARQYGAYSQACLEPEKSVLNAGESTYERLSPASGLNGWDISEPGYYAVQVAVDVEGHGMIVSNSLRLLVEPPRSFDEERLAQDFFRKDVGRILAMGGTQVLTAGNDTLREVTEKMGERRVALHARAALAKPLAQEYKLLDIRESKAGAMTSVEAAGGRVRSVSANVEGAEEMLTPAFTDMGLAAETFGHVGFKRYVDEFSDSLVAAGAKDQAVKMQDDMHEALSERKILKSVLKSIRKRRESIEAAE